jgi:hypothetical protein
VLIKTISTLTWTSAWTRTAPCFLAEPRCMAGSCHHSSPAKCE